jgi:hypothetical protein
MGDRRGEYKVWWGNLSETDYCKHIGTGVRIILKRIFKNWEGGVHWIGLVHERDTWWVIVNAVMNIRVPLNAENFLSS